MLRMTARVCALALFALVGFSFSSGPALATECAPGPLRTPECNTAVIQWDTDHKTVTAADPLPVTMGAAPTGAATAAKQDTGNTSVANIDTNVGAKADSAAVGDTSTASLIALIKRLNQNLTTIDGRVDGLETLATSLNGFVDGLETNTARAGYSAAVTLTRTADTNNYTANDVIGSATGSTAALTFSSIAPAAGEVVITGVQLEIDASAIISGETSYRLYLYNVTPPSALGDNAAFDLGSGDRASYLGFVDLGTPVDLGSTLYVEASGINKPIKVASTSVFGYLVTIGAYQPTSARVHVITLHTVAP